MDQFYWHTGEQRWQDDALSEILAITTAGHIIPTCTTSVNTTYTHKFCTTATSSVNSTGTDHNFCGTAMQVIRRQLHHFHGEPPELTAER
jgi:hypothetical protein